jgi:hypothetical protein
MNAWGEEVEPEQKDKYWVPESDRSDVDEGPESDALDDETGDDMESIGTVLDQLRVR